MGDHLAGSTNRLPELDTTEALPCVGEGQGTRTLGARGISTDCTVLVSLTVTCGQTASLSKL